MKKLYLRAVFIFWIFLICSAFGDKCSATITVLDYYRMGDNDPGAISGSACNSTTIDSVGTKNLTKGNSPSYSSDVESSTVSGTQNRFSIAFTGSPQDYFSYNTPLATVTTGFVLEASIKAFDTSTSARLVYNGYQFGSPNGYGFLDDNGVYEAAIGNGSNLITFGGAPVTTNWVNLALVSDGGVMTFYVDGVANATSSVSPTTPSSGFSIGTTGKIAGVDDVRFSTFTPGSFRTSDFLYQPVPEPSTWEMLMGATGSLLIFRRRR